MKRQARLIYRRKDVFESLTADPLPALVRPLVSVAELVVDQINPQVSWVCVRTALDRLSHCSGNSDIRQLFALQGFPKKVRESLVLFLLDSFELDGCVNLPVRAVKVNDRHRLLPMPSRSLPGVVLSARASRRMFRSETFRSPRSKPLM